MKKMICLSLSIVMLAMGTAQGMFNPVVSVVPGSSRTQTGNRNNTAETLQEEFKSFRTLSYNYAGLKLENADLTDLLTIVNTDLQERHPEVLLLNLGYNAIGNEGAKTLANKITRNGWPISKERSISNVMLELQHNRITGEGALVCVDQIILVAKKQRARIILDLQGNPIDEEAKKKITEKIKEHQGYFQVSF